MSNLAIGWRPFAWQVSAIAAICWRLVIVCARQIGKTTLVLRILLKFVPQAPEGAEVWYISPTLDFARKKFEEFAALVGGRAGFQTHATLLRITFPGGQILRFRSFEQGHKLRGATLWGVVMDECQEMAGWFWRSVISPMLSGGGWAIFLGTPPNPLTAPDPFFFEGLKQRAESGEKGWGLVSFDYHARADTDPVYRIQAEAEMAMMPREEREREYFCQFTEAGEGSLNTSKLRFYKGPPKGPFNTVITVDPAWSEKRAADPRAIAVTGFDSLDNLYGLHLDHGRWGYDEFQDRLFDAWDLAVRKGWNPLLVAIEGNGSGPFKDVLDAEIRRRGSKMFVEKFTSGGSPYDRILSLQPYLERRAIVLPEECDHAAILEEQMAQFPRGLLEGTRQKLSSGDTHHYDLLMAFAFRTRHYLPARRPKPKQPRRDSSLTFGQDFQNFKKPPKRGRRKIVA